MTENTTGTSVAIATPTLNITEGQVTTTSQQVAAHFNKRHDNVMRAIHKLECSDEFRLLNFEEVITEFTNGKGGTQQAPAYRLTRDGFTFLAMGFTGKDAAVWKEAYITAFNKMEAALLAQTTRPANPALDYDRITPAQAQTLKQVVHAIVDAGLQGFAETWARLQRKFRVNSYLELPAARFAEAQHYLLGKLPPQTAAIESAAHAPAPAAAADAPPTLLGRRWLVATSMEGKETVRPIAPSAMVVSAEDLPQHIEQGDFFASDLLLARIASAVAQKQSQRALRREQMQAQKQQQQQQQQRLSA